MIVCCDWSLLCCIQKVVSIDYGDHTVIDSTTYHIAAYICDSQFTDDVHHVTNWLADDPLIDWLIDYLI